MALDIAFLQSEQTLIPFLFVLAIVFGVLERVSIFHNRAVNFIVALAISFFTITNAAFVSILWAQFGNITTFFIIMFLITFVLEVFGLRGPQKPDKGEGGMIINGTILVLILVLGFTHSSLLPSLPYVGGGTNLLILVSLVFILALFWMAFRVGREVAVPPEEKHGSPPRA